MQVRFEVKVQKEGRVVGVAVAVAAAEGVPPYKSWSHLRRNERAVQTGLQQFYLDETGDEVLAIRHPGQ